MTYADPARRIADLELKVDGLVQLVEHLYRELGISPPAYQPPATPPADNDDAITRAIAEGNLIVAIKLYRERTGVGLKEAKDAIDALARGQR